MHINIPELSLVVLIGPSGSGKSTLARAHFLPTEVLSSDICRGLVSDDENNQAATDDAFEVLHFIAAKRLKAGRLTVIDATNVQPEARKPLVALARKYHCLPVALVLDLPETICRQRNAERPERGFGDHVIRNQRSQLHRSLRGLDREGFRHIHVFRSPEELAQLSITRQPLWNNKKQETGPFDIIGDVHGCLDETLALLDRLGYRVTVTDAGYSVTHPEGRKVVFLGDLVDRGPKIPEVLRLVMNVVESGTGFCVAGNHDVKLVKALRGRQVKITHGLAESMTQLAAETEAFRQRVVAFLDSLVSHYVFDGGKLVVAHAGLREEMHGRGSGQVREFALYGETTGEIDEFGLPVRHNWAAEYRGRAMVVYGHTPVPEAEWLNHTLCIDTGCVFGGHLTALRYPERERVSVPARREYYPPIRPLEREPKSTLSTQHQADDLLDLADVTGKRLIHTRLHHSITIREENATAALEVMSRFAANPKWLIYLPPTMAPPAASQVPDYLEHPREALAYYRDHGVTRLICQEKHMGSRAVVILCRDEAAAQRRFGIQGEGRGIVYTRTGRRFFTDSALEQAVLERLSQTLDSAGFWAEFASDWFAFDCELMPWSVKAQDLLRHQYAAVGTAARAWLKAAVGLIEQAQCNQIDVTALQTDYAQRAELTDRYVAAYRRYCWPVTEVADLKLAPFHLLASEGRSYFDQPHVWHMETLHRLAQTDPGWLVATPYRLVDLEDETHIEALIAWWLSRTEHGSEGLVVKPVDFIVRGRRGLLQPAIKCRGREYLRIIYGPEYTRPEHLERLRKRGLSAKRSLALREFALGVEAIERFVRREPLRRVHECVFGVLALESEPVDPLL
jgi:protein phosphatase